MATQEFIKKRIEGKEKELEKLTKKLGRIQKAQASGWKDNPYWYSENDLKWTSRDIESAKKALEGYKKQLEVQVEKDNSRNIKPILEFLEGWKTRMAEYYKNSVKAYVKAREEWYAYEHACKIYDYDWCKAHTSEEVKAAKNEYYAKRHDFYSDWDWIRNYIEHGDILNEEKLQKDLNQEADAKYDFIIERTNAIVGQITDASSLRIGAKGDLNGYIVGTKGTAKVQTIGAGGYNIQCYHFRTLITRKQ